MKALPLRTWNRRVRHEGTTTSNLKQTCETWRHYHFEPETDGWDMKALPLRTWNRRVRHEGTTTSNLKQTCETWRHYHFEPETDVWDMKALPLRTWNRRVRHEGTTTSNLKQTCETWRHYHFEPETDVWDMKALPLRTWNRPIFQACLCPPWDMDSMHACIQYSKWGLTIALYRVQLIYFLYVILLQIIPRITMNKKWLKLSTNFKHRMILREFQVCTRAQWSRTCFPASSFTAFRMLGPSSSSLCWK